MIVTEIDDGLWYWTAPHPAWQPGDRLIGDGRGGLRMCPQSWLELPLAALREELRPLLDLRLDRVLVSHGEPVLSGAPEALRAALADRGQASSVRGGSHFFWSKNGRIGALGGGGSGAPCSGSLMICLSTARAASLSASLIAS